MEYIQSCDEHVLNTTMYLKPYRWCNVKLIADKANYGDYLHYQISCIEEDDIPIFKTIFDLDDSIMYNVVADNTLIRKMLEYLTMSDEELDQHTGHICIEDYRVKIIKFMCSIPD